MAAQADFIGGSVEAAYWSAGIGGHATIGNSSVDTEDDLNLSDDGFFEFAATIEHPVPVLPNVRLKYLSLEQTENGELSAAFDSVSIGDVETKLDLSHMDLILYYEILDNYVSVDIGLDIKKFDGKFTVSNDSNTSSTDIDEAVPLGYLSAEVALPLTDLSLGVEVSGISYSDNSLSDTKVRIRQGFSLAFVELGYRQIDLKIDDISDTDIDIDYSGIYISTGLDF